MRNDARYDRLSVVELGAAAPQTASVPTANTGLVSGLEKNKSGLFCSKPAAAAYLAVGLTGAILVIHFYGVYLDRATCAAGTSLECPPSTAEHCFDAFAPAVNASLRTGFCQTGDFDTLRSAAPLSSPSADALYRCLSRYDVSAEVMALFVAALCSAVISGLGATLCVKSCLAKMRRT